MDLKKILKNLKLSEQTVSTFLGALVVVVIGIIVFNYFRGVGRKETAPITPTPSAQTEEIKLQEDKGQMIPEGLPAKHKVERGENLWSISLKYFGSGYNWVDIAKENKLREPSKLAVSQELTIPKVGVKRPTAVTVKTQFGEPISGSNYTVVKGDHLWGIAVRAYQDGYKWVEVARVNKIAKPGVIHSGNVLIIPR